MIIVVRFQAYVGPFVVMDEIVDVVEGEPLVVRFNGESVVHAISKHLGVFDPILSFLGIAIPVTDFELT